MPEQNHTDSTQDIVIEINLPAQPQYLSLIGTCIRELVESSRDQVAPEDVLYGMQLSVHEICNNIIEHAYGHQAGRIKLVLKLSPSRRIFAADLYDSGREFDQASFVMPSLDEPREEGYGLFLAHQLMDEVQYENHSGKNHWRLLKRY